MQENSIKIIMIGIPNVGKSLVFNTLTNSSQLVGNWCGTTTQLCSAVLAYKGRRLEFTDMPGVYSLEHSALEAVMDREAVDNNCPDVAMVIIEPLNLERSLYLTLQAQEKFQKVFVVCNKILPGYKHGISIDAKELANKLQLPVVVFDEQAPEVIFDMVLTLAEEPLNRNRVISKSDDIDEVSQLKIISQQYFLASEIAKACVQHLPEKTSQSEKIDKWALHPYFGIPIMFLIFGILFYITFAFSKPVSELISNMFDILGERVALLFPLLGMPDFLTSLMADGLIKGIGATLTFLPQMVVFFMVYSLIQDSGYIVRVAFLMDKLMNAIGLNGKFFLPIIVGCSCNVNGILAARVLSSRYDHLVAILVNSFVPCSARLGVIVFLVSAFFPSGQATLVLLSLMLIGIMLMALVAYAAKLFIDKDEETAFMMELPYYQFPRPVDLLKTTMNKTAHFLARIKNVIIYSSVIMWFLSSYPQGPFAGTYIAQIGQILEPLGKLLGFNWQLIVALLLGVAAKETTLTALGIMYHAADEHGNLAQLLSSSIDPLAGFTFVLVYMIYTPCVATVLTVYQETKDWKITVLSIASNMFLALTLGMIVYNVGRLLI